jgi:hypothetical protein
MPAVMRRVILISVLIGLLTNCHQETTEIPSSIKFNEYESELIDTANEIWIVKRMPELMAEDTQWNRYLNIVYLQMLDSILSGKLNRTVEVFTNCENLDCSNSVIYTYNSRIDFLHEETLLMKKVRRKYLRIPFKEMVNCNGLTIAANTLRTGQENANVEFAVFIEWLINDCYKGFDQDYGFKEMAYTLDSLSIENVDFLGMKENYVHEILFYIQEELGKEGIILNLYSNNRTALPVKST